MLNKVLVLSLSSLLLLNLFLSHPSPESLYPTLRKQVVKIQVKAPLPDDLFIQLLAAAAGMKELKVSGSGVILGKQGKVVTANHVVNIPGRSSVIGITTEGTRVGCRVLSQDDSRDLALLVCDGLAGVNGVRHFSSILVPVGSRVVAAGCAGGGPLIISDGILANREPNKGKWLVSVMGGPGMSGGGVFTYDGALVGIIQAGYNRPPFTMISTNDIQLRRFLFNKLTVN